MAESNNQCAYCHSPTSITGARLVIDHIIPESAGGQTVLDNLCLACHSCNEFKGAEAEARDPLTDEFAPLYHPRQQEWKDHFHLSFLQCLEQFTVSQPKPPGHAAQSNIAGQVALVQMPDGRLIPFVQK
ncbi:MAG: HNH endonuclease [Chloroflexi bacterium]|nr:HNH endonuclease [Chloroflexota bacterium]